MGRVIQAVAELPCNRPETIWMDHSGWILDLFRSLLGQALVVHMNFETIFFVSRVCSIKRRSWETLQQLRRNSPSPFSSMTKCVFLLTPLLPLEVTDLLGRKIVLPEDYLLAQVTCFWKQGAVRIGKLIENRRTCSPIDRRLFCNIRAFASKGRVKSIRFKELLARATANTKLPVVQHSMHCTKLSLLSIRLN